jgi:kynurenine formamidase
MAAINQLTYTCFSYRNAKNYRCFALLLSLKSAYIMYSKEIIDLTHTMENNMPVFPGSPTASFVIAATFEEEGYHEIRIDCSTHTGTHIDCGFHLLKDGLNTLTTPITHFYGKGLLVDCRNIPAGGMIEKEFLQPLESELKRSSFLLGNRKISRRISRTASGCCGLPVIL